MSDCDALDAVRDLLALWQAVADLARAGGATVEEAAEAAALVLVQRSRNGATL